MAFQFFPTVDWRFHLWSVHCRPLHSSCQNTFFRFGLTKAYRANTFCFALVALLFLFFWCWVVLIRQLLLPGILLGGCDFRPIDAWTTLSRVRICRGHLIGQVPVQSHRLECNSPHQLLGLFNPSLAEILRGQLQTWDYKKNQKDTKDATRGDWWLIYKMQGHISLPYKLVEPPQEHLRISKDRHENQSCWTGTCLQNWVRRCDLYKMMVAAISWNWCHRSWLTEEIQEGIKNDEKTRFWSLHFFCSIIKQNIHHLLTFSFKSGPMAFWASKMHWHEPRWIQENGMT